MDEKNNFAIDVRNLNKSFAGKPAVIDLALQVRSGEIFGFLGPNGSGKTTTIRMLCGLLVPDSGEGQVLGYDILTQSDFIKLQVGYMTQHFSLYEELTIRENLDFIARIYGIADYKSHVDKALETMGMERRQNQLAGQLSGGWKQRLALSAALLHKPKLLLLDEPTAGVDPQARRDFWDQVHRLGSEGVTTLVSTHYMDEVERCQKIAYIAYGNLLVQGTVEEVIAKSGLITWLVTGENLYALAGNLHSLPGVQQASVFGNSLHVSGKDPELMESSLAPFQKLHQYRWERISPSVEDVFISLTAESQEGRQFD